MAIPNPNPNIRDYEQSDAFTWSSNKIKSSISSAAELPEVSESDNGEVLGVVEGSWSKMEIPEPDLDAIVIVYKSTPDYPAYFDGMTGAEKIAAIRSLAKSGRLVLKEANNSSDYYRVADSDENLNEIRFVKIEDDDVIIKTITYSGTSLSGETTHYSSLPTVVAADKGKYLTVSNNGAWVKSSSALSLDAVKLGDISYSNDTLTITLNSSAGVWNRANVESLLRDKGFGKYYFSYNGNDWCRLPVACIAYDQGVENFVVIGYFYNPNAVPAKYQKITVFINKDNENYDKIFIEEITPST